ncbi:MAG TPA: ABC transporter substrate-binding protein [Myxococcaceae bacterium]|nr:ABC transporter substrate-binding protein [Myxococcaceae bacterium]
MLRTIAPAALLLAALVSTAAVAAPAQDASRPVKTVVQAVRYSKDDLALKQFALEAQGAFLLEDQWKKGTPAQREEFKALFQKLFALMAFPKIRENFEHLATINYDAAKVAGNTASINSLILINHPLKKQELKVAYDVVKEGAGWKVKDVSVLGDSMLLGIRDGQIRPIMKKGGWDHLLTLMRARVKALDKK